MCQQLATTEACYQSYQRFQMEKANSHQTMNGNIHTNMYIGHLEIKDTLQNVETTSEMTIRLLDKNNNDKMTTMTSHGQKRHPATESRSCQDQDENMGQFRKKETKNNHLMYYNMTSEDRKHV